MPTKQETFDTVAGQTRRFDAYDSMVAYLAQHPDEIVNAWYNGSGHRCHPLFAHATPDGEPRENCGCLTQIRATFGNGCHKLVVCERNDLTDAIADDDRIPVSPNEIGGHNLPVFAEWQRVLDKELNREPPIWRG